jgi:hypothetical protein
MDFKVGDRVRWFSSNTSKEGVVIEIIPPNFSINKMKYPSLRNAGYAREHRSFVVRGNEVGTKKVRVYWPRVSLLEPMIPPLDFVQFIYTNHRGITETRRVQVKGIRFGTSEYYPVPEWLITGFDTARNAMREFAVRKMRPTE